VNRIIHRLNDVNPRILDGENIVVYNYATSEASSTDGSFIYDPSNTHFDEVATYYHGDEFESWLVSKGMSPTRVAKVTATVHYYTYYAASIPSLRLMYFQDSYTGLNNPTFESAVIAHEYAHIVSETYNTLTQNDSAGAMDEAYSDYFGLAYANQFVGTSVIGEYIDQAGGPTWSRNLINTYTLSQFGSIDLEPNGVFEEHDNSVIMSGALWDFRKDADVNGGIADQLVLESLNNLDNSPGFFDGRDALKAAAIASGYSSYTDDIDAAFAGHGIGTVVWPLSVSISGPSVVYHADPKGQPANCESWTANVTGGVSPYSYAWTGGYGTPSGSSYQECFSWNGYGGGQYQFTLRVDVTDSQSSTAFATKSVTAYNSGGEIDPIAAPGSDLQLVRVPQEYSLGQNYPNPFNPETQISYALPEPSDVTITVSDLLGREIAALVHGQVGKGYHVARWNGTDNSGNKVGSGIYFYRINAVGERGKRFTKVMKMLFAK